MTVSYYLLLDWTGYCFFHVPIQLSRQQFLLNEHCCKQAFYLPSAQVSWLRGWVSVCVCIHSLAHKYSNNNDFSSFVSVHQHNGC